MLSNETCTAGARWGELFTQRYWAATVTLCLGVALFAFNAFLVSTALPTAVREIGGVAVIAWATSIYLALSIVGGAAASRLKARYGARAALIASAVLFLGGTLLAATASSMTEVLIGRALQGIGEGIISALCYTLIPELFPGRLIAKVFGAEAVVWATGRVRRSAARGPGHRDDIVAGGLPDQRPGHCDLHRARSRRRSSRVGRSRARTHADPPACGDRGRHHARDVQRDCHIARRHGRARASGRRGAGRDDRA